MCKPTAKPRGMKTDQLSAGVTELDRAANSSRSRRRERRKEARSSGGNGKGNRNRRNKSGDRGEPAALTTPHRRQNRRRTSLTTVVSAESSDGSSSSSCRTPEPKRRQCCENNSNASSSQKSRKAARAGRKRRLPKKAGKEKKPVVIAEVEDIPEEVKRNYVAIDCEMVGVGEYGTESALARVSITDWEGDVVMDKYVKVDEEVTDYRTFVSGITRSDLESDDAITFDECQDLVMNIMYGKVLVGHALKNDLNALRICGHPWYMIRDTARYEPFMKKDPMDEDALVAKKLKDLARDKLGMTIQEEGTCHDSIEDATAAMELYKKARRKWEKAVEWKMNKTKSILEKQGKGAGEAALALSQ